MADHLPVGPPGRFPNTRLRSSVHPLDAPIPTNTNGTSADPDTCRICRGEGTPEEPLFYPCRCSGSIKHVHQDCLMEWLSHSQKKHCELCKTPFRFTKLYDPNMPKALPWHVFVSHMAKYLFTNLLVWLRAALVFCVWLGGLPYLMRTVWRLLFWFSDEGLGGYLFYPKYHGTSGNHAGHRLGTCQPDQDPARQHLGNTTCPATNLPMPGTAYLAKGASSIVGQVSNGSSAWLTVFGLLFKSHDNPTPTANVTTPPAPARTSTLLSGVKFLRNLTRHDWLNDKVIEILEGQIVTIVVIVCFILIILVRDYVVQQQPEINMRAAFAAAENVELPPQEPAEEHDDIDGGDDGDDGDDVVVEAPDSEHNGGRAVGLLDTLQDGGMRWDDDGATASSAPAPRVRDEFQVRDQFGPAFLAPAGARHAPSEPAPTRPPRNRLFEEQAVSAGNALDQDGPLAQYLILYREANGDPQRILDLARERGLEARLEYWMRLTRSMLDRNRPLPFGDDSDLENVLPTPSSSAETEIDPTDLLPWRNTQTREAQKAFEAAKKRGIHEVFETNMLNDPESSADSKGKGKAMDDTDRNDDITGPLDSRVLRPRANTDGPKISDAIHPLANNSWSFNNLPQDPTVDLATSAEEASSAQGRSGHAMEENNVADDFSAAPSDEVIYNTNASDAESAPNTTIPHPHQFGQTGGVGADANVEEPRQQPEAPVPVPRRQPVGLVERVADFMWRDVAEIDLADLAAVDAAPLDFDEEDDDVEDDQRGDGLQGDDVERDLEVVEAAVAAGLDPEAIEDAEDLEGILELLGMRGPVAGLFQNAIFCAFLVSITVFLGIVVPYNIGRFTVWMIANPIRLARILFSLCMVVQDFAMVVLGFASWAISLSLHGFTTLLRLTSASAYMTTTSASSWAMMASAVNRVGSSFVEEFPPFSGTEIQNFSAISHEALLLLKDRVALAFSALWLPVDFAMGGDYLNKSSVAVSVVANVTLLAFEGVKELPSIVANPNTWVLNLSLPEQTTATFNPELTHWGAADRFWAVAIGYITMSIMAGVYLRRGSPISTGPTGQEWEASIIEGLNQASGVMKVILIIGIEMLVFPLYCGMLLDLATLPLFEGTTIKSRILFTMEYPLTSIFVHWFVGTGYMFHFALFVSMCRKIMRKGVLYFIRDPDDPEFHPVRDVLERNVTTQLRKILFSAFVYGALVMVCLGGVVWGLAATISSVLPIHYSTHEPVLEFPIDLLFYNFLMPLAFRYFKPTDGLHHMYTWWFRKCARVLRVTWFLFGERRLDEEGRLFLGSDSPDAKLPWWRKLFLEVDENGTKAEVQAKGWADVFRSPGKPAILPTPQTLLMNGPKLILVQSGQLIPDGRFVRAPASDQVKIPKGRRVFLEVTEGNERPDNSLATVNDLYSSEQYQFVYVPPHFRLRITLFILFIWIFAAVTGVSLTIVPLVFGRWMFKKLIPDHIRTNDIYAFTIGIHVLGLVAYAVCHIRSIYQVTAAWVQNTFSTVANGEAARRLLDTSRRVAKIVYAVFFYYIVFPFLVASLMELYALIPLHELMYSALLQSGSSVSGKVAETAGPQLTPPHTIRVLQAWTIGLLYLKLSNRIITTWFRRTRLAAAVMAIFRRGWLDPDIVVLTRAFIIPGLTFWATAVVMPLFFAKLAINKGLVESIFPTTDALPLTEQSGLHHAHIVLVHRLSFPITALTVAACFALLSMFGVFRSWKARIRDEAYLIGERLHNFGVAVQSGTPKAKGNSNANAAWRGGRL